MNDLDEPIKLSEEQQKEIDQEYQDFWAEIVETDGHIDIEKVKLELYDYSQAIRNISIVYDVLTGSRISKPFTNPSTVIEEIEEHFRRFYNGQRS